MKLPYYNIPNGTTFYLTDRYDHPQFKAQDGSCTFAAPNQDTIFYVKGDTDTMDYNGWTNRETWQVKLYQDNDYASNKEAAALAHRCAMIKLGRVTGKVFDRDVAITAFKRLMSPVFQQVQKEEQRKLVVNWGEIVDSYIDDEIAEIIYAEKGE